MKGLIATIITVCLMVSVNFLFCLDAPWWVICAPVFSYLTAIVIKLTVFIYKANKQRKEALKSIRKKQDMIREIQKNRHKNG